jgi:hypothetical protein
MTHFALFAWMVAAQSTVPAAQEPLQDTLQGTSQGTPPAQEPASGLDAQDDPDELEREAAEIAGAREGAWDLEIHGYLKSSYLYSEDTTLYAQRGASGFSFDAARFWFESEVAGWRIHLGYRGEVGGGIGFFAAADEPGVLRAIESTAVRSIYEDVWFTVGRFRAPLVTSALLEEDKLLFYHRTFIGTEWDRYLNGVMVHGRYGQLRAWIAAQNGSDQAGEDIGFTARAAWDIFGGGTGYEREGAYGASEDLALTVSAGFYEETQGGDDGAQAAEARMSVAGLYVGGEIVDNGEDLGDLYSWAVMASWLVLPSTEIGGVAEDFDRDDSTDLYRVGLTQYLLEGDALVQVIYANADSNAPLADSEVLIVGFTVSF